MSGKLRIHARVCLGVAVSFALFAFARTARSPAQNEGASESQGQLSVKRVPVKQSNEVSGEKLFQTSCAPCHGRHGKGDGPAAPALKAIPPDLTLLAKDNGGKFPGDFVSTVLDNGWHYPGHGTKEMPIWGPLFRGMAKGDDAGARLRAANVIEYLKSIQRK
jgi:mono/diheme cytochrome c family protein